MLSRVAGAPCGIDPPARIIPNDAPAAAPLTAARQIFARLGAKPTLAETEELMQQVTSARRGD